MGMTMTQKILAKHAGLPTVEVGQLIEAKLDLVLGNDITAPVAISQFEKAGLTQVFDQDKIAIVLDHYTPCKDIKAAQLCKTARDFAHKHHITHFFDVGRVGVEHALLPEAGAGSAPVRVHHRRGLPHLYLRRAGRILHRQSAPPTSPPAWLQASPWFKVPRCHQGRADRASCDPMSAARTLSST